MKKTLALIIASAMAVSSFAVSAAAEEESYPEVKVVIDGSEIEADQPAVIVDSRTMVPIRVIAETLGIEVNWEAETKTVTFSKDTLSASMVVGEAVLNVTKGEMTIPVDIDAPAIIINSRTMVPVRFISENFGAEVDWDAETKTVSVTSPKAEEPAVSEDESADQTEEKDTVEGESEETTEAAEDADKASTDELIAAAKTAVSYADQLKENKNKLSKSQQKSLNDYADSAAAAIETLEADDVTEEAIAACDEDIKAATSGLMDLAKAAKVTLVDPEQPAEEEKSEEEKAPEVTADEVKALYTEADILVANMEAKAPDYTSEQQDAFDEYKETIAKIGDSIGDEDQDLAEAKKALEEATAGINELADDLNISL